MEDFKFSKIDIISAKITEAKKICELAEKICEDKAFTRALTREYDFLVQIKEGMIS